MKDVAAEIRCIVEEAPALLARMDSGRAPGGVAAKPGPAEWSKKEILGHLIDSAANNHQRFVRAAYNAAAAFPLYDQIAWVQIQQYQESDWGGLVALWAAYNRHLSDVIERLPQAALSAPCNIGQEEPATLEFVARDYVRHLRHHVDQLLDVGAAQG